MRSRVGARDDMGWQCLRFERGMTKGGARDDNMLKSPEEPVPRGFRLVFKRRLDAVLTSLRVCRLR